MQPSIDPARQRPDLRPPTATRRSAPSSASPNDQRVWLWVGAQAHIKGLDRALAALRSAAGHDAAGRRHRARIQGGAQAAALHQAQGAGTRALPRLPRGYPGADGGRRRAGSSVAPRCHRPGHPGSGRERPAVGRDRRLRICRARRRRQAPASCCRNRSRRRISTPRSRVCAIRRWPSTMSAAGIEYGRETEPVTGLDQAADVIDGPIRRAAGRAARPRAGTARATASPMLRSRSSSRPTIGRTRSMPCCGRWRGNRTRTSRWSSPTMARRRTPPTLLKSWQAALARSRSRTSGRSTAAFAPAEIRNRAILASSGAYCIFLDGDCIPRNDFVQAAPRARRDSAGSSSATAS